MSNYNRWQTLLLYTITGIVYGTYGSRVCPMLETLTTKEIFTHVSLVFIGLFLVRHFFLSNHKLVTQHRFAELDTKLFFVASLPFAAYYNLLYDFPLDSNFKVVFGMTLFGYLTGTILQLSSKLKCFDHLMMKDKEQFQLSGTRRSLVKQLVGLMSFLLIALATMLTMVAVKDIFWLEHNPERFFDGTGTISIIKEFAYLTVVLGGYLASILYLWTQLMQKVLATQEASLLAVAQGDISQRVPIFEHDEIGSMAHLTNQMLDSLQAMQTEVLNTRDVAIVSLSTLAESRDNETGAHIRRTQNYVKALACHLSRTEKYSSLLTPDYIDILLKSAPLHDVGKVGIPDSVLLKPGKLTDEEFEIMKGHAEIGANALSIAEQHLGSSSFLDVAKEIALTHHEKWDGNGYPNQLKGEEIPLSGRLMALADVYDALISKRVYKPAFSHEKAKTIILEGNGAYFDPEIVQAFLEVEEEFKRIAAKFQDKEESETINLVEATV